jgi:predicted MPP superfamily phosphohydrolase
MSRLTYATLPPRSSRIAAGLSHLRRLAAGRTNRSAPQVWLRGGPEEYSLNGFTARRNGGTWRFPNGIEVSDQRIWLDGLPEAFRGFRIVHLTDLHHGLFLPLQELMDAVRLANELEPDLIALTGDFVTYSRAYIAPAAAVLGRLRARHGVVAVLGNHDFRVGADEVTRALRREQIDVLRNRHTAIRRAGHTLYLAGVDDLGYGADLTRALHRVPRGAPAILLSHNPGIIRRASRWGVGLILSGHTHGGQVNLPLVGTIYGRSPERLRFKVGWDRLGPTQIYVSRGIGTIILPLRLRCPAEIPHLHLQPHAARASDWAAD